MNTKTVILVVLALLAIIFMVQNTAVTPIKLILWSIFVPRVLLIMILLLAGFTMGYVVHDMKVRKGKRAE
jgi:uncharacterized integral membrane protein